MARRLSVIGLALALWACAQPAQGELQLNWLLPATNMGGLASVSLEPVWAGAGQGRVRDKGWQRIAVPCGTTAGRATFPTVDDRALPVACGHLPAASYDHVYVAAGNVQGTSGQGAPVEPVNHVEPIALTVDLSPGGSVVVDIELIVLPRAARSGGGWQVFVKDARLVSASATGLGTAEALRRRWAGSRGGDG